MELYLEKHRSDFKQYIMESTDNVSMDNKNCDM